MFQVLLHINLYIRYSTHIISINSTPVECILSPFSICRSREVLEIKQFLTMFLYVTKIKFELRAG